MQSLEVGRSVAGRKQMDSLSVEHFLALAFRTKW